MKNNIIKIFIIAGITSILVLFGISQYKYKKTKDSSIYTTIQKSSASVMIMGGMASDKKKIDSFKADMEKDREYWDSIHASSRYEERGDYENAIIQREKALKSSNILGDIWQARVGLVRLYEKIGKYDLAVKQYDWIIPYQEEALADSARKGYKLDVERRQKLVDKLKEGRKRVEELKVKSKTTPVVN